MAQSGDPRRAQGHIKITALLFVGNGLLLALAFTILFLVCMVALENTAVEQTEENLKSFAKAISKMIPDDESRTDAFVKELTHSDASFRITLIAPDGAVAADSVADPATMENHALRDEVRLALRGEEGSSIHSSSVIEGEGERVMYYAMPVVHREDGATWALRISMPVEETVFFSSSTRTHFVAATIFLFVCVLSFSFVISNMTVQPLYQLKRATEEYAKGNFAFRLHVTSPQEMAELSDSFNLMADTITQNITNLKRLEQIRKDFVANVSHELKTPVTSIKGFTETLLEDGTKDDETAKHFLGIMNTQCERLANIIEDLLILSRVENDMDSFQKAPMDVVQIAQNACSDLLPLAEAKGITLSFYSSDEEIVMMGNAGLMEQAVANLIDNSIKYCPKGSHVDCRVEREGINVIKITVEDDGKGIPPQYRDRIFERFFRIDKGRSREEGGTGLGLSIVRHIVNIHGGSVRETGRADGRCGAHFEIVLPQ